MAATTLGVRTVPWQDWGHAGDYFWILLFPWGPLAYCSVCLTCSLSAQFHTWLQEQDVGQVRMDFVWEAQRFPDYPFKNHIPPSCLAILSHSALSFLVGHLSLTWQIIYAYVCLFSWLWAQWEPRCFLFSTCCIPTGLHSTWPFVKAEDILIQ